MYRTIINISDQQYEFLKRLLDLANEETYFINLVGTDAMEQAITLEKYGLVAIYPLASDTKHCCITDAGSWLVEKFIFISDEKYEYSKKHLYEHIQKIEKNHD